VNIEHQSDKIVITIDISEAARKRASPSSSGKTLMVATTNGFKRVGPVSVSLNCTVPNPNYMPPNL
jgi:hypothetical protein